MFSVEKLEQKKRELAQRKDLSVDDINEWVSLIDNHLQVLCGVEENKKDVIDESLKRTLDEIFGWAQEIRLTAHGKVIQSTIEEYLSEKSIPVDEVINMKKWRPNRGKIKGISEDLDIPLDGLI